MSRTQFRAIYLTLTMTFVLPLLVSVISDQINQVAANDWKHYWPYFAGAAVLILATLARHTIHSRPAADLAEVADRLACSISEQWRAEAATRKINDPVTLPVPWRMVRDPLFDDTPGNAGGMSLFDDLFGAIPTQRLIVLGKPGAGKTALLVDLVLRLLQRQDRETGWADRPHSDQIVPVLFSLSSWSPDQTLRDWLVDRLETEHPELQAPEHSDPEAPTRARALVGRNLILPVLDGFDEIPDVKRVEALGKVSEALQYSPMGIVIASRDHEFRVAADAPASEVGVAPGAVVVLLDDVTAGAAAHYLDPRGKGRWAKVLAELGQDSPVGRALRTPLMISLAYAVYNRRPPGRPETALPSPDQLLAFNSEEEVRYHLFDACIPAAYRDQPGKAGSAVRWLTALARYLDAGRDPLRRRPTKSPEPAAQTTASRRPAGADLAWWRLRASVPRPVVGLIVGLPPAVAVGLVAGLTPGLGSGLGLGTVAGFAAGAAPGLVRHGSWRVPPSRDSIGAGIAGGFAGALLGATLGGLVVWATGDGR